MKNLRLSVFMCVCFLAMLFSMTSMGDTLSTTTTDGANVPLNGDLPSSSLTRSLISPIEAFVIGESIEVDFNATLGAIDVSIYDEAGGVVYKQSINASSGKQLFIDMSSFDSGNYTIEFTNAQGQYLSGDFTI